MRKQEQIEEMVKTVVDREKNYVIGETECKKCNLNKCDLHCNIHSEISYDCETLYNAGYRKAEEVRKETAKVILEIMSNIICEMYGEDAPCNYNDIDEYMFNNCRNYCDKNCTNGHFANCWKMFLKAKIKEYGVEVEE